MLRKKAKTVTKLTLEGWHQSKTKTRTLREYQITSHWAGQKADAHLVISHHQFSLSRNRILNTTHKTSRFLKIKNDSGQRETVCLTTLWCLKFYFVYQHPICSTFYYPGQKKEPSSRFAARRTLFHAWYHARSGAISAGQKSRIGLALRWSRLIEHDITRGTAFFSPRISMMVLFFGQGSRKKVHYLTREWKHHVKGEYTHSATAYGDYFYNFL